MRGISSFRNTSNRSNSGGGGQKKEKNKKKQSKEEHPRASGMVATQESSGGAESGANSSVDLESVIREFLVRFGKESEDDFKMLNFEFLEIRKEQTNLQASDEYRCSIGQKIAHFVRNRYRDILPYDKTRVVLSTSADNADGYINASHISHPNTSGKYIAAQAPLSSTVEDFWQMAFENGADIVGMLCKCVENGMPKCEKYWGDDEASADVCDSVSAYKVEETSFDDFVYRKLRVKSDKYGVAEKLIHQLHYTEWPDHGCPNGEKNVLEFMDLLSKLRGQCEKKGPILLHCSAGCGRTGSVIAIDIFRELLTSKRLSEINLKQLVIELRKQRVCMVQTPGQYQFLHKCIAHYCKQFLGPVDNSTSEEGRKSATKEDYPNAPSNGDLLLPNPTNPDDRDKTVPLTSSTPTSDGEHQAVDVRF